MLLIGQLPRLLGELGLPIVMIERAGLQIGGKALLFGDGLQLGLFPFLPLADELLLLFEKLLPGGGKFGLGGFVMLTIAAQLFVLVGLFGQFAGENLQALIELRFERSDAIALFIEGRLRHGTPLFQPERNGRVPLIGGGDIQSVVVHVCCALVSD